MSRCADNGGECCGDPSCRWPCQAKPDEPLTTPDAEADRFVRAWSSVIAAVLLLMTAMAAWLR